MTKKTCFFLLLVRYTYRVLETRPFNVLQLTRLLSQEDCQGFQTPAWIRRVHIHLQSLDNWSWTHSKLCSNSEKYHIHCNTLYHTQPKWFSIKSISIRQSIMVITSYWCTYGPKIWNWPLNATSWNLHKERILFFNSSQWKT